MIWDVFVHADFEDTDTTLHRLNLKSFSIVADTTHEACVAVQKALAQFPGLHADIWNTSSNPEDWDQSTSIVITIGSVN